MTPEVLLALVAGAAGTVILWTGCSWFSARYTLRRSPGLVGWVLERSWFGVDQPVIVGGEPGRVARLQRTSRGFHLIEVELGDGAAVWVRTNDANVVPASAGCVR